VRSQDEGRFARLPLPLRRSPCAPSDGLGKQRGDELIEAHALGRGQAAQLVVQRLGNALAPLAERGGPKNLPPQLARRVLPFLDRGKRVLKRRLARFSVAVAAGERRDGGEPSSAIGFGQRLDDNCVIGFARLLFSFPFRNDLEGLREFFGSCPKELEGSSASSSLSDLNGKPLILLQFGFSGLHENRSHFKVLAA
jgi:hypothetical protein